ncbi:MAG: hypothetical protein PWQ55_2239 [Chloroflexota bacterium]|nr:hypothetical protein [Chloroflexota bacterium]
MLFLFSFSAIFGLLNQAVMDAYQLQYPIDRPQTFEQPMREDYRAQIEQEEPQIVAVGDSAIRELNADYFSQLLDRKTLIFSAPATGSAYWYLFLRHQILEAENKPQMVFFFFRNVTLTVPGYLTNGSYRARLEETATTSDADVYALAIAADENPLLRLPERYIPLFAYRSEIYQNMVTQVRDWLPGRLLDCDDVCVDQGFDQVFDEYNINAFLWEELVRNLDSSLDQPENFDFAANVEDSFLPLMLQDAQDAGITPVFIRVKYRSRAEGEPDSSEMAAYQQALQAYVEDHGGIYMDLGEEDQLTADMYRDGIHLAYDEAPGASVIIAQFIREKLSGELSTDEHR